MNKFTKLLSIFVIAGAVGCGVGAVAGCKSNTPSHTHSSVKHEKVDATCTADGTEEYYTCSAAGCEGKYYSDEACTQEVELADLTIANKGGHTDKYTDNGDGTHNKECEYGDLTATKENHKDVNSDYECDDCHAKLYTISLVPKQDSTCEAAGMEAHYKSNDPALKDVYYSDAEGKNVVTAESLVIPKKDHTDADGNNQCDVCKTYYITLVPEVDSTCAATGMKAHYVSHDPALAGKYYSDAEGKTEVTAESLVIPKKDHTDANDDKQCDVCQAYFITKVEEVPATCHSEGMRAHYVSHDPALKDKYYSDAEGTVEVTAESLKIEKLPHTVVQGTPNEDATHNGPCTAEGCGETAKNLPCVDKDADDKCDVCGGDLAFIKNVITPGTYINRETKTEFILNADGFSVSYTPDSTSAQKTGIVDLTAEGPTWTIEFEDGKTETVGFTRNGLKAGDNYIVPAPAEIATTLEMFKGKFDGELVLISSGSVTKLSDFSIYGDGSMLVTVSKGVKGSDGTITYSDSYVTSVYAYYGEIWHNSINQYIEGLKIDFTAIEGSANGVSKIEVAYGETKSELVYVSAPAAKVSELPTNNFTIYANGDNKLLCNYNYGKSYSLYYAADNVVEGYVTVLSGDDTNGYLIYTEAYTADYSLVKLNYLLKMVKTGDEITAIEMYDLDGTLLDTLALNEQEFPLLKEDGTANTGAVVDAFNTTYAYYKADKAGWYTFASENGANLYTKVSITDTEHYVDWTPTTIEAGGNIIVRLEAGAYVAVNVYDGVVEFTSTYSATEPERDWLLFTDGSCTIANFNNSKTYYLKGTAATAGKYYVSFVDDDRDDTSGPSFEIEGTKYGYYYDNSAWKVLPHVAGTVYSADLEAGAEVKIYFGCEVSWASLTNVTVYFETEEQYNNRINGGGSTTPTDPDNPGPDVPTEVFTADQQGTYTYEYINEGTSVTTTIVVGASEVTYSDSYFTLGNKYALAYESVADGVYTCKHSAMGMGITFSFVEGNLSVTSDGFNNKQYVAEKQVETPQGNALSVGPNEINVTDNTNGNIYTFTATEAGDYVITFDATGAVMIETDGVSEEIASERTVQLAEGETLTLVCFMFDMGASSGSFNLNIAKV